MAIELITGRAGTPHVDSADVGAMNAALFGSDVYILAGMSAELVDANNVRISAGELLAEGRHIRITGSGETLAITNGLSGYNRNDVIAAKYLRDGNGIETVSLIVIKGSNASGTPADPAMPTSGKLINGASEVYWPLYRVTVNGLTPQAPAMVASSWTAYFGGDSIIAEGTSDGWNWAKYANGNAFAVKKLSYSQAINTGIYVGYQGTSQNFSFPFTMPTVNGILVDANTPASAHVIVNNFTNTNFNLRWFSGNTVTINVTPFVAIFGKWK